MITGIAIDPGLHRSGVVLFEVEPGALASPWGIVPLSAEDVENHELAERLANNRSDVLVIEVMKGIYEAGASGDCLGAERWAGEFRGVSRHRWQEARIIEVPRQTAKAATIGRPRGTDAQVRAAIFDAYGGKAAALGVKCEECKGKGWIGRGRPPCPVCDGSCWSVPKGPLHGWTGSHGFAALACVFAAFERGGLYYSED